jgi:uncharacterized protein YeaO (DUF488 family)
LEVEVVRVYDDPGRHGDYRVLVDRLWPRGIAKVSLDADEWLKDVAPSTALRQWYGHEPDRFEEFARRYRREIEEDPARSAVSGLLEKAKGHRLTLLTATKDVACSGAAVLQQVLLDH